MNQIKEYRRMASNRLIVRFFVEAMSSSLGAVPSPEIFRTYTNL